MAHKVIAMSMGDNSKQNVSKNEFFPFDKNTTLSQQWHMTVVQVHLYKFVVKPLIYFIVQNVVFKFSFFSFFIHLNFHSFFVQF